MHPVTGARPLGGALTAAGGAWRWRWGLSMAAPPTQQQRTLAKTLTKLLRAYYRDTGRNDWVDLDVVRARHRRFATVPMADFLVAIYDSRRGARRFEVWWDADPLAFEGFRYQFRFAPGQESNRFGQ